MFSVNLDRKGGISIIRAIGNMEINKGSLAIKVMLIDCLRNGDQKFIVDTAKLALFDGPFLSAILKGYFDARDRGGKLVLLNVGEDLKRAIEKNHFSFEFEMFSTESEALKSFRN